MTRTSEGAGFKRRQEKNRARREYIYSDNTKINWPHAGQRWVFKLQKMQMTSEPGVTPGSRVLLYDIRRRLVTEIENSDSMNKLFGNEIKIYVTARVEIDYTAGPHKYRINILSKVNPRGW